MRKDIEISVIIPMFNEEEVIAESYRRLNEVMSTLDCGYELVFINDGSRDRTMELITAIREKDEHVKIVDFARNFGHQIAVTAGMRYVSGRCGVIIDADLQDPPELIPGMMAKWREGYDVVYGKRVERKGESAFKLATARAFYRFINKMTNNMVPVDTGDFRLIDRKVVDTMNSMPEHARFLRGMGSWVGFKQYAYEYKRDERWAGTTKYPLKKMLKLASDGIVSFSNKPLTLAASWGIAFSALSVLWLIAQLILWLCGVSIGLWQPIVAANLLFCGIVLLNMGIMGAYMARIYDETKARPLFVVRRTYGLGEKED